MGAAGAHRRSCRVYGRPGCGRNVFVSSVDNSDDGLGGHGADRVARVDVDVVEHFGSDDGQNFKAQATPDNQAAVNDRRK